jgi:hypothetical protein
VLTKELLKSRQQFGQIDLPKLRMYQAGRCCASRFNWEIGVNSRGMTKR